eukprot:scaffold316740_cov39-Prasinocladus_malaysianus.AAC.1
MAPIRTAFVASCVVLLLSAVAAAAGGRKLLGPNLRKQFEAEVEAIIVNEIGDYEKNDVRTAILAEMASTNDEDTIKNFQTDLSTIISNVLNGNKNAVEALIRLAIANNQDIDKLRDELAFYVVNDLTGDKNAVDALADVIYLRGGS